ncbi:TetR family transcriptional regulator ActII [Acrocarpospora macrocephala]|uniref:Transcriptional regulator n=1 Tax=Acrocarpospora macrocephala TaxID=150177 RepID=A0A5M3WR06_9ACTN|nr:TetR/AcrR family transcriptional regulator [Acrocarpospora macrocephala]GES10916.1 transcriptional regulator [Acrocarpospora macrocephala]
MSETDLPSPPWDRNRRRPAPAKVPLTRDRIVDAAYTVLDREGYDRFSMRQVALELGVAVSALYVHVANKDELFELMYNRTFVGEELPDPDPENWQEQIKEFARRGRARLRQHRDLARISMAHIPFTPELLPHVERLMAIFRSSGMPDLVAAMAGDLLSTYIEGFCLEESMWLERYRDMDEETWETKRTEIMNYFAELPPDRFPNMVAMAPYMVDESNDYRFELGVDILVRGLASYIPAR